MALNKRVRVSISEMARLVFLDATEDEELFIKRIGGEHPEVSETVLDEIDKISDLRSDRCLQVYWELQPDKQFRWHVMIHRTKTKTDNPVNYYLCELYAKDMLHSGPFLPLDMRVVNHLREHYPKDNMAILADMRYRENVKRIKQLALSIDQAEQEAKSVERLHKRLFKFNPADPGWSPGISFDPLTGLYKTADGPLGRKVVSAVARKRS